MPEFTPSVFRDVSSLLVAGLACLPGHASFTPAQREFIAGLLARSDA